jgi:hypothetical protein
LARSSTAHGRLLTLDLPATAFVCLVLYAAWRFWQRPGWWRLVAWGVALGLAGATRYTLVFVVPVLVGWSVDRLVGWSIGRVIGVVGIIAALTVWAIYGFTFGPVPDWGIRLPAPAYFYDLKELLAYRDKPQDAFLLGKHYTGGWWPYFVVTLAVKTPLPVLVLLGAALASLVRPTQVDAETCFGSLSGEVRRGELLIIAHPDRRWLLLRVEPVQPIQHRPSPPAADPAVARHPRRTAGSTAGRGATSVPLRDRRSARLAGVRHVAHLSPLPGLL